MFCLFLFLLDFLHVIFFFFTVKMRCLYGVHVFEFVKYSDIVLCCYLARAFNDIH